MLNSRFRLPRRLKYKPRPKSVVITVHADGTFTVKDVTKRDGYTLTEIKAKFLPNANFDEIERPNQFKRK